MPEIKLNKKQQEAFGKGSSLDQLNAMDPMQALKSGLGIESNPEFEAKKKMLQQMSQDNRPKVNPRPPEEDLELKRKGMNAFQNVKDEEARKQINLLQQGIQDAESMQQFGDPEAEKQIQIKKELLRRYLNQ